MADRMGLLLVVEGLSDYKNATVTVQKLNDDVAKSLVAVEGDSAKAAKGTENLTAAFIKGSLAASAIQKGLSMVAGFAKKLIVGSTMLAARVEVLGVVLNQVGSNAGYSAQQMAEFEETVKAQGITTQAARQSLIQMAQANIDFAHASDIARLAQNAAVIAGIDSSQAFQRLTTGIQRGSILMLRTMGIAVNFQKAYEDLAVTLDKTTKELTEVERMQARINEVMRSGQTIAGTYEAAMGKAGKQMTSIPRYLEEIQLALGAAFQPAFTALIFEAKEILADLLGVLQDNEVELREAATAMGDLITELIELRGEIPAEDIKTFIESFTTLVRMLQVGIETVRELEGEFAGLGKALEITKDALVGIALPWTKLTGGLKELTGGWGSLMSVLNKTRKEYEVLVDYEETQLQIQKELAGQTGDLADEMRSLKQHDREAARATDELNDAMMRTIELSDDQIKAVEALGKLRLDMQRDYADRLVEQERDAIKKSIEIQREREDIARDYAKNVADAYAEAEVARAELPTESAERMQDFERRAQEAIIDMERTAAADREKIDTDFARKRVDIEKDTHRKLRQIREQFEMSVQDAARSRDAVALVMATRRSQRERENALRSRDERVADARTQADRQKADHAKALAERRAQVQRSLAEQRVDLQQSLQEEQQMIETQLQEALAAADAERQADLEAMALKLTREQEMETLQAQWEEEDRQKRLARQLEDIKRQYGMIGDVTAAGLVEQMEAWAAAYGPEGAATHIVANYAKFLEEETEKMRDGMVDMAEDWADTMRTLSDVGMGIPMLPPELQFQSPKLGLQIGLEKLQDFMKAQPLNIFAGGQQPMMGTQVSRSESFSRSEETFKGSVDVGLPPDIDAVVAQQLLSVLKPAIAGRARR